MTPGLIQIGKGQPGVPGSGAFMLPPPADCCQECAKKHEPEMPHDALSLPYQYSFANKNGRWPTWADAVAHCTPEMQAAWKDELMKIGGWSEPGDKKTMPPELRVANKLMGVEVVSPKKTMEPGNIMKMEVIEMGDGLQRAVGAAVQSSLPIKVKVGQWWRDNDPRHSDARGVKVLKIVGDKALVQNQGGTGRKTKIKLARFKPTTTGYKLVRDVP